jgi:hypothetical protein
MSPKLQKTLLVVLGSAIAALPFALPVLAPFHILFASVGSALGGGALIRSPGDERPRATRAGVK